MWFGLPNNLVAFKVWCSSTCQEMKIDIFHKCYSVMTKRFYTDYSGVCKKFPNTKEEITFICWVFFVLDPAGDRKHFIDDMSQTKPKLYWLYLQCIHEFCFCELVFTILQKNWEPLGNPWIITKHRGLYLDKVKYRYKFRNTSLHQSKFSLY